MSDSNVKPIREEAITPELLLEGLKHDIAQIDELYVVAFTQDGKVWRCMSGDTKGAALAGAILTQDALAGSKN